MEVIRELRGIAQSFCTPGAILEALAPLGEGNINDTYLVRTSGPVNRFVLQKINRNVFKQPEEVIVNAGKLYRHLKEKALPLRLLEPITAHGGTLYVRDEAGDYWRAFVYIPDTVSLDHAQTPELAFKAAQGMALFLSGLSDLDPASLSEVIPHFHDSLWRLRGFEEAVLRDAAGRLNQVQQEVDFIRKEKKVFEQVAEAGFPQRVVHNDAKMGNYLFSRDGEKVVAVIDWDTAMPGAIVSDFGDMVRTMATSLSENDPRFDQVVLRKAWFEALVRGFVPPMKPFVQRVELEQLLLGAKWIILEQTMRFLGDYINGDTYYKIQYPEHNLVRARNQQALYQSLLDQESALEEVVREAL